VKPDSEGRGESGDGNGVAFEFEFGNEPWRFDVANGLGGMVSRSVWEEVADTVDATDIIEPDIEAERVTGAGPGLDKYCCCCGW